MIKIKQKIIKFARNLNDTNLSPLRSGNLSIRTKLKNKIEGFFITPSGIKYDALTTKDIVFVSLKGEYDNKGLNPSSEWRFHQDIYLNKKTCNAIVHAHSMYATALSSHRVNIPAFHYMVAVAGGIDIKCAQYETFGTRQLSNNIIKALKDRKACLIANHGQITYGNSLDEAFELAEEVENISKQYLIARQVGKPINLSLNQMEKVLIKFKDYKK
jgi:L-fuculose-phosphate aldolase